MQKGGCFHPPFVYCFIRLLLIACAVPLVANGFGKPDLPSVWPAPGRIRFSGLCLVRVSGSRRWLHLRFPALLAPPALGLACFCGLGVGYFSGFYLVRLFRFSALPALPVFSLACSSGFQPCLLIRFPALATSPVPGLACSFGFQPCLLTRLPDLPGFQSCMPLLLLILPPPSAAPALPASAAPGL